MPFTPAGSLACCFPSPGRCRASFLALPGGHFLSREHRTCQHGSDQQKMQPRCHLLRQLQEQLSQLGKTQSISAGTKGAIAAGDALCSPCFGSSILKLCMAAGLVVLLWVTCPRESRSSPCCVPWETRSSRSLLPPRSASRMVPRMSAMWWRLLDETTRTRRSPCLWQT